MNSGSEAAPSFAGLSLDKPRLFGVINVTPDSFSDGGEALALGDALKRGRAMLDDGADILDVGGESTRPGAEPVSAEEERARVVPVVKELSEMGALVSIDTRRAEVMAARLAEAPPLPPVDWRPAGSWRPELSRRHYEDMVSRAISYIHAGDIFQANLTQRLLGTRPEGLSPFMLYRRLRALSPAPFGAYLTAGPGLAIASASPERFLKLTPGGHVSTRPIKGTRPRGRTPAEDEKLARDLTGSEKDQAENLMIVDLLRNDLSRVCRLGSVEVKELAGLESFANVHHLVSEVRGTLFPNRGAVDLLRATFPGGSVTGAPKIRAMEIINELEPARRGPYCGAIAWIGFDGAMDSSIVIRTLVIKDRQVAAQAGGGIVADSDPGAEYEEAMDKAWAMLQSLDPGEIARGEIAKERA